LRKEGREEPRVVKARGQSERGGSKLPDIHVRSSATDGTSLANSRMKISEITGGKTRLRLPKTNKIGAREDLLAKAKLRRNSPQFRAAQKEKEYNTIA
jgi:hypothetical protein